MMRPFMPPPNLNLKQTWALIGASLPLFDYLTDLLFISKTVIFPGHIPQVNLIKVWWDCHQPDGHVMATPDTTNTSSQFVALSWEMPVWTSRWLNLALNMSGFASMTRPLINVSPNITWVLTCASLACFSISRSNSHSWVNLTMWHDIAINWIVDLLLPWPALQPSNDIS